MDQHMGVSSSTPIPVERTGGFAVAHALTASPVWHRFALGGILLLAAFLNFFRLTHEGYSNLYYAATVRSMLTSWHTFFFASYDPGGFVTVDKPPLGFWIQALSAKLFGFHEWSLLLPQALAGILSVALLYHLVRRAFGPLAGLIAALALAVAPINVATNRNNTPDSLLVLTVLIATWFASRAAETGRLRWLLLALGMVGVGFNIKMLQAFLVLPALYLLYLVAAPLRWRTRLTHLALATMVLLGVSLSWAIVVDLTPADQRPYVGGSANNSVMNLITGYNGLSRLSGNLGSVQQAVPNGVGHQPPAGIQPMPAANAAEPSNPGDQQGMASGHQPMITSIGGETGKRGLLRLLNEQLAGQIGWLLPLAGLGWLVAAWQYPLRRPINRQQQALLLWGMWLLTQVVFFSVAGFWHRYYLVMLSPAIAALVGAGVVALWDDYRHRRWRGWLLPAALLGMAVLQASILADYPDWNRWLTPFVVGLCIVAAICLGVARVSARVRKYVWPGVAASIGVLALFIAPIAWAAITVGNAPGDMLPVAGPQQLEDQPFAPGGGAGVGIIGIGPSADADPKLVSYLRANRGQAKFLVATLSSGDASPMILASGEPVMSLGGFGADRILTNDQLADRVARGEVRFFLLPSAMTADGPAGAPHGELLSDNAGWVQEHCEPVPSELWQSTPAQSADTGSVGMLGGQTLYDCGQTGR